jgi:hypothetical protein
LEIGQVEGVEGAVGSGESVWVVCAYCWVMEGLFIWGPGRLSLN